jgi:hypothetical protein
MKAGTAIAARTPITATTIINSISVKPAAGDARHPRRRSLPGADIRIVAVAAGLACLLHLVALRLVTQIPGTPPRPATGSPLAGIGEAIRLVLSLSALRLVLGVTLVMNVFGFSYNSILPAFGGLAFSASSAAIGLLAAAEPLGALLGGLWLALGRRTPPGPGPRQPRTVLAARPLRQRQGLGPDRYPPGTIPAARYLMWYRTVSVA